MEMGKRRRKQRITRRKREKELGKERRKEKMSRRKG